MIIAGMSTPLSAPMPLPPHSGDALPAHTLSWVDLAEWAWIRAEGPDAASFLQGQLTQDVLTLGEERARPAGYCTAKGRLLATFVLWREGPESVGLACSRDVVEATVKRLRMFVLRAKCVLTVMDDRPLRGVLGHLPQTLGDADWATHHEDGLRWIRLPAADGLPPCAMVVPDAGVAAPSFSPAAREAWDLAEVTRAVPRVVAATVDHFVPQMVNLELVGGVNFQKGCYPGQEVVARSQYRGTLKRRAFLLDSPVPLAPGAEIFHAEDPEQPAGEVVLCARQGSAHVVLAEMKIAATQGGSLHAGSAGGERLALRALPYALPTEAA